MTPETTVRSTTFTQPSDREIVATRMFDFPRQLIWDAHTQCEHARQWLLGPEGWGMPFCEIDLREGGKYHYVWRSDDGTNEFGMHGEYREVMPLQRLLNTESMDGQPGESLNTLTLSEEGGKTKLTVSAKYESKETLDAALSTGMTDGWAESYDRLERYLSTLR